jgi:hypothetical protein
MSKFLEFFGFASREKTGNRKFAEKKQPEQTPPQPEQTPTIAGATASPEPAEQTLAPVGGSFSYTPPQPQPEPSQQQTPERSQQQAQEPPQAKKIFTFTPPGADGVTAPDTQAQAKAAPAPDTQAQAETAPAPDTQAQAEAAPQQEEPQQKKSYTFIPPA